MSARFLDAARHLTVPDMLPPPRLPDAASQDLRTLPIAASTTETASPFTAYRPHPLPPELLSSQIWALEVARCPRAPPATAISDPFPVKSCLNSRLNAPPLAAFTAAVTPPAAISLRELPFLRFPRPLATVRVFIPGLLPTPRLPSVVAPPPQTADPPPLSLPFYSRFFHHGRVDVRSSIGRASNPNQRS